ncbi:MAG: hypothetical protein LBT84_00875 [Spirochaetia bacterium]|jgi:hypothetical protein|nr:hypothetical protein [Spirochaetia bacterium]
MYNETIESFISALKNKKERGNIDYQLALNTIEKPLKNIQIKGINVPENISVFYLKISSLYICTPRCLELLSPMNFEIIDKRYIWFSTINKVNKICFDFKYLNSAKQWDIINLDTKFLITQTLSSYITNKIWAWIDRERKIWENEF